ncbi:MAG: hypothetical protein QNJ89_11020 [Acidimicrobiia bacterium]|nr:hypothetical protein [Acidimicrobiia bacterium]
MIDTAFVERRMREVNPVPGLDDINGEELSRAVAAAHARTADGVEGRKHPDVTELQPITQRISRGRRVWVFAAALVLVVAGIGIAALLLRSSDTPVADQPLDEISVDSLQWSRITLAPGSLNVGIELFSFWTSPALLAEGGPGLVAAATIATGPGERDQVSVAWTTADGYEWSQSPPENDTAGVFDIDDHVAGIASGNNVMVVVGGDRAWTSSDGITWAGVPDGAFGHPVEIHGVIAGGPGFAAFGEDRLWGRGAIWTSSDGTNWTRAADDPALSNGRINAMTAGGPGLVAVGSDRASCAPVVWTSSNGQEWTRIPYDPEVFGTGFRCDNAAWISINDVTAGGPGLVAVGSHQELATVWTSQDGVTWTRSPDDPELFGTPPDMWYSDIRRVATVGDELIAIGWRGGPAAVWTSPDGLAWSDITNEIDPGHDELVMDSMMMDVLAGDSAVVILGSDSEPREIVMWIGSPSEPGG